MGTRSLIGVYTKDTNKVTFAYTQFEGFIEHTGKLLKENYNTLELAQSIVDLKEFSYLKPTLDETSQLVYGDARTFEPVSLEEYGRDELKREYLVNYLYLFIDGKWQVKTDDKFTDF